jgi:hypothetical protein
MFSSVEESNFSEDQRKALLERLKVEYRQSALASPSSLSI